MGITFRMCTRCRIFQRGDCDGCHDDCKTCRNRKDGGGEEYAESIGEEIREGDAE